LNSFGKSEHEELLEKGILGSRAEGEADRNVKFDIGLNINETFKRLIVYKQILLINKD
jgi:hypothetical protein